LIKLNIPTDIYDKAKMSNINKEEITALNDKINLLKKEFDNYAKLSTSAIWLLDLTDLEKKYNSIYKNN